MERYPFIFGAQYYRAPTPEPELWEGDLRRMQELGLTDVKLFVQWRWSHRGEERFYFDDLDRLMDLAGENGLRVTLNTLFDMSPLWLFKRFPDAKQVDATGHVIEPYAVGHRQIGGHPGPCYNHQGAREMRLRFMAEAVEHFKGHAALAMWDVWNEPEQSLTSRAPNLKTLVCYCPNCQAKFAEWLRAKYGSLEHWNQVWGRCYEAWEQVELPVDGGTITDFVDWREFQLDTMTGEAAWRLEMVKERDPRHVRYLHVVPNVMSVFSSVTCVDDFALAPHCEVFAATMNGGPILATQVVSAARTALTGKVCYNVESHVNYGGTDMHQRMLGQQELLRDFLPQIGLGIKGFLFWQYRSEVLGAESPAWGLVKLDGTDRPITRAVRDFWATLWPHAGALLNAMPPVPQVGLWKSRKNETFHFATQGSLQPLITSVEAYIDALYGNSYPFRIVSGDMLAAGELEGIRLLVMPSCYYLTEEEAAALDRWVRAGGVLLNEAHLGGYNGTTGRHSRTLPGCGLAQAWGIREVDSTSSYHLRLSESERQAIAATASAAMTEDARKALLDFGTTGGAVFPIQLADGTLGYGAHRYAILEGEGAMSEGMFDGVNPVLLSKRVGDGRVFYCGTNLGMGAGKGDMALMTLLRKATEAAGVRPVMAARADEPGMVHVDLLGEGAAGRFAVVLNRTERPQKLWLNAHENWRGVFTGTEWRLDGASQMELPASFVDLFVRE
jgi:beta-galactosidase